MKCIHCGASPCLGDCPATSPFLKVLSLLNQVADDSSDHDHDDDDTEDPGPSIYVAPTWPHG